MSDQRLISRMTPPYTEADFYAAYFRWSKATCFDRDSFWHQYCDVRDQVPLGTSVNRKFQAFRYDYFGSKVFAS